MGKNPRVVYAASSSCYGIPDLYPTPETAEIRPQYPYALTKNLGEQLVLHWAQVYKLPTVSLRFFNVYGPRSRTSGTYGAVFGVFLAQKLAGAPFTIVGDGQQTRDFTYVMDIVDALIQAGWSEKAIGEEMNIASAREIEIVQLAETINQLTGNKAGLLYTDRRKWDTKSRLLASIDRAKDLLGYDPQTTFEEGLKKTIQWFRDNWEAINRDAEFPPGMSSAVKNYVLSQKQDQT